jgi:hypothetical protein
MTDDEAIQLFRSRGTIPPGHGDTIAAFLQGRREGGDV